MSSQEIPAFTLLENTIDTGPLAWQYEHPKMPKWQSQYQANFTDAPPNSSILEYNMPHMIKDYPAPKLDMPYPEIPYGYDNTFDHNNMVNQRSIKWNLPNIPPEPMPSKIMLPTLHPPYGTSYPTNGYSQYDASLAMNAGIPQFKFNPGVPAASWPALQDARDSPSVPLGPATLAIVAENHFKEGFEKGLEHFKGLNNCGSFIDHMINCPVCFNYFNGWKKIYHIGIGILLFILLMLLITIYKSNKRK